MSPLRQLATRNYEDKKPEWCRIFWYNAANSSCQIITTLFTPADEERAIGSSGKRNKWEKMWCRKVERNENRARRTGINNKKKRDKKGKSVNGGKMKGHEEGNGWEKWERERLYRRSRANMEREKERGISQSASISNVLWRVHRDSSVDSANIYWQILF